VPQVEKLSLTRSLPGIRLPHCHVECKDQSGTSKPKQSFCWLWLSNKEHLCNACARCRLSFRQPGWVWVDWHSPVTVQLNAQIARLVSHDPEPSMLTPVCTPTVQPNEEVSQPGHRAACTALDTNNLRSDCQESLHAFGAEVVTQTV